MVEIISRFGNLLEQVFPLFNIRFIAINDFVDSYKNPSSTNTILVPFKNLINDEYSRDTSTKIKSSLNGKKKKGEFIGAFPSYGYVKNIKDKHKLEIDEKAANIVRKIFDWNVNKGLGKIAISHRLNDLGVLNPTGHKRLELNQNYNNSGIKDENYNWTPSTIKKILENEIYIGNTVQGKRRTKSYKIHKLENVPREEWVRVENTHKPIIDKELFLKAQKINKIDTRVQSNQKLSLFSGILICGDCKMAMNKKVFKSKSGKIYEYYVCGTYRKKSKNLCSKHTVKVDKLETSLLETIRNEILKIDVNKIIEKFENINSKKILNENKKEFFENEKKEELEKLERLKRFLYEDWKNGDITREEYIDYKKRYDEDINKIRVFIENLKKQNEEKKDEENKNNKWMEKFKNEKNIFELDREIILELVDFIEIFENEKIKIHFKFSNIN